MSTESDLVDDANPLGKTPEEIDRSNRWFRIAVALGKQDDYIEMLATERRLAREHPDSPSRSEKTKPCPKCGCYGGNGRIPRQDDTWDSCPECTKGSSA
jgi:hypothetical protein